MKELSCRPCFDESLEPDVKCGACMSTLKKLTETRIEELTLKMLILRECDYDIVGMHYNTIERLVISDDLAYEMLLESYESSHAIEDSVERESLPEPLIDFGMDSPSPEEYNAAVENLFLPSENPPEFLNPNEFWNKPEPSMFERIKKWFIDIFTEL